MAQKDPGLTPDMHRCGQWVTNVPCDRIDDVQHNVWNPSGAIITTPAQWDNLNKPLDPAKVQQAYEKIEAGKAADPYRDQRERLLRAAGNPEKDGKLDVEAFTPREWAVAPHHTPWKVVGKTPAEDVWYSYSSFGDVSGQQTYVALKVAMRDMNGGYSQLTLYSGQIDCSRPGVYPRMLYRALGSTYDPDTGYPQGADTEPSNITVDTSTALGPVTKHVCDLVNGAGAKH